MPNRLSILRRRPATTEAHHLAGMFILDETSGIADLIVVSEASRKSLEVLSRGVWQAQLGRSVVPADGALYLTALESYFGHSSDWVARRD